MPRRDPAAADYTRARITRVFEESGETMQAFAGKAGLSTAAISRILSGVRSASRDSIERIARASGHSAAWFYPPTSGLRDGLELLGELEPEVEAALARLRGDPERMQAVRRLLRAAVVTLAALETGSGTRADEAALPDPVVAPPAEAGTRRKRGSKRSGRRPR